jgi:hypothetical protein
VPFSRQAAPRAERQAEHGPERSDSSWTGRHGASVWASVTGRLIGWVYRDAREARATPRPSLGSRRRYRDGATAAIGARGLRLLSRWDEGGLRVLHLWPHGSYKLGKMILPQLEQGTHGVEVVGLFFFDDNTYLLRAGDPLDHVITL